MTSVLTIPVSSDNLAKLRRPGQICHPCIALPASNIVFSGYINEVVTSKDSVVSISYSQDSIEDEFIGDYGDIIPGMTLWIGTTPNSRDIGMARIRKSATSSHIYIGETSELDLEILQYLTVVDDFSVWNRSLKINHDKTVSMDWDIEYTNQHTKRIPVVCMGSHAVVNVQDGPQVVNFDASESSIPTSSTTPAIFYIPAGGGHYSWSCLGGSVSSSDTEANITISEPGTYLVQCAVNYNDATGYGYRKIYAYDDAHPPIADFKIRSCTGTFDTGGWEAQIETTNYELSQIQDRQLVILFADDWYYDDSGILVNESIGPLEGRENIILWGYIDGKSIQSNMTGGITSFTVKGPQFWVGQITGFIDGVETTIKTPSKWTEIKNLSVDLAIWHFVVWRTTLSLCCDFHFTGDTRYMQASKIPAGSLWQQLDDILFSNIMGKIRSNRYGMVYTRIDVQYLLSRTSVPNVMDIEKQDRLPEFVLDVIENLVTSRVELSGVNIRPGYKPRAFFSLANGHVFKHYGTPKQVSNLLLTNQISSNRLAGLILGVDNNPYPRLEVTLTENNRFFDICPDQTFRFTFSTDDSPLQISFDKKFVPRVVSFDFNRGYLTVKLEGEALAVADPLYINGDVPADTSYPPIKPPSVPRPSIPPITRVPGKTGGIRFMAVMVYGSGVYYTRHLETPEWDIIEGGGEPLAYRDMVITRDGTVYIMCQNMVYYAPTALVPSFSICFDPQMIVDDFGGSLLDIQITAIGINPTSPNEVYFIIVGLGQSYIYKGQNGTFSKWADIWWGLTNASIGNQPAGTITQGMTYVLYTGWGDVNRNAWARYDFDGVQIASGSFDASYGYWHRRVGTGDEVYLHSTSAPVMLYSADNGITTASANFSNTNALGRIDCSPKGNNIMGSFDGSTNLSRSGDHGENHELTTPLPTGYANNVIHCHSEKTWVFAGMSTIPLDGSYPVVVYITTDFGDTFVNKSGNFSDVLPSPVGPVYAVVTL